MPQLVEVEVWKQIPEWLAYEVSNLGRVQSYWTRKGARGRKGQVVLCQQPTLIKGNSTSGRLTVTLGAGTNGGQETFGVAYLVLWTFVRPPVEGEIARHVIDPDPNNCRLVNLRHCEA